MSSSQEPSRVAYFEDVEDGADSLLEVRTGPRHYARSEAYPSPSKERPNTGKSRADKRPSVRRGESSSSSSGRGSPKKDKEKRMSLQREAELKELRRREKKRQEEAASLKLKLGKEASSSRKTRPPLTKHAATQPVVQQTSSRRHGYEDLRPYDTQQPAISGPRPRAKSRPASYSAPQSSRPPNAYVAWPSSHQVTSPFPVGTFPPPQMNPFPPPSPGYSYFPQSSGGQPSYHESVGAFHHNHLKQRFESRPSSAAGYYPQPPTRSYTHEVYEEQPERTRVVRRQSVSRKQAEDRKKMPPPPPRAQTTLPQTASPFRPPPAPIQRPQSRHDYPRPPSAHRRSVGFVDRSGYEDDDFIDGDNSLFHDISPPPAHEQPRRFQRPRGTSGVYDISGRDIFPARSQSRRSSMHGLSGLETGGVSLEDDKYLDAVKYQEQVSGGPNTPLTAETLRKAAKRGGVASSRSTRSSGSRDDSEHKRSSTTGMTRLSTGPEDFTVKVSGAAVVRIPGGPEIECDDGEITFSSRASEPRGGSDRASSIYQLEDSRSRMDRRALPLRSRAPSQSDSQSRGYARSRAAYDTTYGGDNFI